MIDGIIFKIWKAIVLEVEQVKPAQIERRRCNRRRTCVVSNLRRTGGNKYYSILIFILLCTYCSCQFTPKGGGNLVVSTSIAESKEKGMFQREYSFPDSVFEYKDSIINIKLVFSDIFVENTHKEIKRIPAYKEKRYYNSGCDTCSEQFVAHFKIEDCELEYSDGYWYIDERRMNRTDLIYTYFIYEKFIPDTLKLHVVSGYKYEDIIGIDSRSSICLGTLTFIKKDNVQTISVRQ